MGKTRICTDPNCHLAGQEQPIENFYTNHYRCKVCDKEAAKQRRFEKRTPASVKENIRCKLYNAKERYDKYAILNNGINNVTADELYFIFAFFDFQCMYCGEPWEAIEHIVPLSKGGDSIMENMGPVCTHCNSSKRDLDLVAWADKQGISDECIAKIVYSMEHLRDIYAYYQTL